MKRRSAPLYGLYGSRRTLRFYDVFHYMYYLLSFSVLLPDWSFGVLLSFGLSSSAVVAASATSGIEQ